MSILMNIGAILTGTVLISLIIYLVVEKKVSESHSVLWIGIGLVSIILGIFPAIIDFVATKLGIGYPPSILFVIAYVGLLFIVLRTTVITSIQSNQINELFMDVVLLNKENEKLKMELESLKKGVDNY